MNDAVVRFMFSGSAIELEVDLHVWVNIKKIELASEGVYEFYGRIVDSPGIDYLRLRAQPLKPGEPSPFKKIKSPACEHKAKVFRGTTDKGIRERYKMGSKS